MKYWPEKSPLNRQLAEYRPSSARYCRILQLRPSLRRHPPVRHDQRRQTIDAQNILPVKFPLTGHARMYITATRSLSFSNPAFGCRREPLSVVRKVLLPYLENRIPFGILLTRISNTPRGDRREDFRLHFPEPLILVIRLSYLIYTPHSCSHAVTLRQRLQILSPLF